MKLEYIVSGLFIRQIIDAVEKVLESLDETKPEVQGTNNPTLRLLADSLDSRRREDNDSVVLMFCFDRADGSTRTFEVYVPDLASESCFGLRMENSRHDVLRETYPCEFDFDGGNQGVANNIARLIGEFFFDTNTLLSAETDEPLPNFVGLVREKLFAKSVSA